MAIQNYLLYLLFVLCTGCSPFPQPVGGPCEYETFIGVSRIRQKDGNFWGTFTSTALKDERLHNVEFPIQRVGFSAKVIYPAEFKRITSGSCTPYFLTLLTTDRSGNHGIFLEFTEDGKLLTTAEQMTRQIGQTFMALQDLAVSLHLCGQTSHTGSDEYNLNLSERYNRMVAKILQEEDVLQEQITTVNMGEYGCSPTCSLSHHNLNGVCVSFL